jgi:N-sulfoglucosamine sulfohydrolase
MVSWIDLLPTLSEIAGRKITDRIDGRSFLPVLRGAEQKHRDQIFSTHSGDGRMNVYPMRSLRTADWKYILNLHPEYAYTTHIDLAKDRDGLKYWSTWLHAAESNDHSRRIVTRYRQRPAEELYNLRTDPHETNNLAADPAHTARLKSLRTDLEKIMNQHPDPRKTFAAPRLLP